MELYYLVMAITNYSWYWTLMISFLSPTYNSTHAQHLKSYKENAWTTIVFFENTLEIILWFSFKKRICIVSKTYFLLPVLSNYIYYLCYIYLRQLVTNGDIVSKFHMGVLTNYCCINYDNTLVFFTSEFLILTTL